MAENARYGNSYTNLTRNYIIGCIFMVARKHDICYIYCTISSILFRSRKSNNIKIVWIKLSLPPDGRRWWFSAFSKIPRPPEI